MQSATEKPCAEIVCAKSDRVRVKGRETPVAIYQPLGEALTPAERDESDRYQGALALYRERKFDQACTAFKALAAERPELALYATSAQRAGEFAAVAPLFETVLQHSQLNSLKRSRRSMAPVIVIDRVDKWTKQTKDLWMRCCP